MPKRFLLLLILLLLLSQGFSISAQEALDFATKQNNFLEQGETSEIYPNVRIQDKGSKYWVITVLRGTDLTSFIPVTDKTQPGLAESTIARRELIKTAYVLRYESKLKENSAAQGLWLFDAQNVSFFSSLEQDLKNERVDLTTIRTELSSYPLIQVDTDLLVAKLDKMHPLAADISDALLEATSFENSFIAGPDTNKLSLFRKQFSDCFDLIGGLDEKRAEYLASLDELRQSIALTDLPIESKQSLNSLANVPSSLQQFGTKASISLDLDEQFDSIFANAQSNVESFATDLATREKKNEAFQALYGRDDEIFEKTGQGSLSGLMDVLFSDQYYYYWRNQAELADAEQNWGKAKAFYASGSYQQAGQYATRAKGDALNVYADGIEEPSPIIDTDLLFTATVLLIIALIIIYILRNREKLSGLVSPVEEEVPLHEWEK